MVNIMEKESSDGVLTRSFSIRENLNEGKCMASEFLITHMEYLKVNSNSASLRVKQLPLSIMVISIRASFIIHR